LLLYFVETDHIAEIYSE